MSLGVHQVSGDTGILVLLSETAAVKATHLWTKQEWPFPKACLSARQNPDKIKEMGYNGRVFSPPYLTEEHKYPMMLLEDRGNRQVDRSYRAERVTKQLATYEAFTLQRPNVNLLLAVRKRAVTRVSALLSHGNILKSKKKKKLTVKLD